MMTWPILPLDQWQPTRDTVHLWTQIVGKTRTALAPPLNYWWNSTLYVSARGLTISLMPLPGGGAEIEFDFTRHELTISTTSGAVRRMALIPRSVSDFYAEFRTHRFRADFRGKASPVHFFWGSFDLAVTRFSGRRAPRHPGGAPNCPDWVMAEACSDEVSSCGYWPGGGGEGICYCYAYPSPPGFASYPVAPGRFDEERGEFVLPYAAVREAADPHSYLLDFLNSTFQAADTLAAWPDEELA